MSADQVSRKSGTDATVKVKAGDSLFRQGDLVTHCYVVKSGQIAIVRAEAAAELRLAVLGPGDLFGETALVEGRLSEVEARAAIDTTLVKVEAPAFADVVRQRPEVGLLALRRLAARGAAECAAWASQMAEAEAARRAPAAEPQTGEAAVPIAAGPSTATARPRFVHAETATVFELPDRDEALVGRADPRTKFQPDIELSGVDAQRSLSRRHARISRHDGRFAVVEESRVANGTFVNGRRITAGDPVALEDGDEVSFGLVRTIFRAR